MEKWTVPDHMKQLADKSTRFLAMINRELSNTTLTS